MKCMICGKECNQAFLRLGGYCSEEHRQEVLNRHRRLLDELGKEDLLAMPETLSLADFERLALKLAVHLIRAMKPTTRELYRRLAPGLLDPLEMAAELKGLILPHLPGTHVTLQEVTGLARMFHDGTYTFTQPIPASLVREALRQAHVLP